MRQFLVATVGLLLLTITCSAVTAGRPNPRDTANGMVDAMIKGDFPAAVKDFDVTMTSAMPADRLAQTWSKLVTQAGVFKSRVGNRETDEAGFHTVYVTCQFNNALLDVKVVFDKDGKIGGLWFVPHRAAESPYSTPSYVHRDRFAEREITIGKGEWQLPGTLSVPKGTARYPAVVLVQGSGPEDRDETIGPNRPFRDIAWGLASKGIAVLRYEKRTKAYPLKMAGLDKLTPKEEVIDDAIAAVEALRRLPDIAPDKIFVVGHSLGGILAPRIATSDPAIAGLVIMAGCARPLEDVTLEQLTYIASLSKSLSADEMKQMDSYREQIAAIKALQPSAKSSASSLLLGAPASYWLDLRGYAPAKTAKSQKQPMLILQGERDYQSTTKDYELWKDTLAGRADVTMKLYNDLNHLFMTGVGKATPSEYEKPGSVAEEVIDDISNWVKRQ